MRSNLPNSPIFYVYIYLDPQQHGKYIYGDYSFEYKPFYVGKGHKDRYKHHVTRGNKYNKHLHNKIKKIKKELDSDPIIIFDKENLIENESIILEKDLITNIGRLNLKTGPLLNLTDGGDGLSGYIATTETRKKLSKAGKNRIHSSETKQKIREGNKGKVVSEETKNKLRLRPILEETKLKMSIAKKDKYNGQNNPNFGKSMSESNKRKQSDRMKGENNPMYGYICSEEERQTRRIRINGDKNPSKRLEVREKISNSLKGKKRSKESIQKMIETRKRNRFLKNLEKIKNE